jgi:transcriptional regulator with GAF, ATPase, and Fis domain
MTSHPAPPRHAGDMPGSRATESRTPPTPSLHAWVHAGDAAGAVPLSRVTSELSRAGVPSRSLADGRADGPGVLLFEEYTPALAELVARLSRGGHELVIAVCTNARMLADRRCWRLLRAGAADLFAWEHSATPGEEIVARMQRWRAVSEILDSPRVRRHLVGESPAWRAVLRRVVEAARFTDASMLITGESGCGKELVARLIHDLDPRPDKGELVVLDCGSVVPTLSGSEFFGHERGAFTGAVASRAGAFELADRGTLFLDEIGELPLPLQAELLRVVQEGTFQRLGSSRWRTTRFRLVCATNRDLLAGDGFRADLYFRIAAWSCRLPPLRERPEDILLLARHFLRELRDGADPPEFDAPVQELLRGRDYPGNVRDLRHLMVRLSVRHVGPGPVTLGDFPPEEWPDGEEATGWRDAAFVHAIRRAVDGGAGMREVAEAAADTAMAIAVDEEGGNLRRASDRLGVTARALQLRRQRGRG